MTAPRSAVIHTKPVTTALIELIGTVTLRPCGDVDAPPDGSLEDGYTIVYPIPGGSFDGPALWAPEADAVLVYQITSVSAERSAAEWLADRVRLTLLSRASGGGFQVAFPPLAGMKVIQREPDGTPPGILPEGPPAHRIFNIPERYRLAVVST